jgi:AcrR family transcriptional regulator
MSTQPDTSPAPEPDVAVPGGAPAAAGPGLVEAASGLPRAAASRLIDLTGATIRAINPSSGDGATATERNGATPEVDTRGRIIEAAAAVFREKGFTGTRVVDIARRAGYTSGALYGYFDSRAELLAEAIASASSQMLERLLGTFGVGESPDPMAVLDAALAQLTVPLDESDQMLLDGVALAHREPVAGERLAAALGRFRAQLQGPVADGDDAAVLADGAADLLVILVLGITAARALGLHESPPDEIREHLAGCLVPRAD